MGSYDQDSVTSLHHTGYDPFSEAREKVHTWVQARHTPAASLGIQSFPDRGEGDAWVSRLSGELQLGEAALCRAEPDPYFRSICPDHSHLATQPYARRHKHWLGSHVIRPTRHLRCCAGALGTKALTHKRFLARRDHRDPQVRFKDFS